MRVSPRDLGNGGYTPASLDFSSTQCFLISMTNGGVVYQQEEQGWEWKTEKNTGCSRK